LFNKFQRANIIPVGYYSEIQIRADSLFVSIFSVPDHNRLFAQNRIAVNNAPIVCLIIISAY